MSPHRGGQYDCGWSLQSKYFSIIPGLPPAHSFLYAAYRCYCIFLSANQINKDQSALFVLSIAIKTRFDQATISKDADHHQPVNPFLLLILNLFLLRGSSSLWLTS